MNIVEIGPNRIPVYAYCQYVADKLSMGATYLGIDIKEEDLKDLFRPLRIPNVPMLICADLKHLPLPDNFADEMWLMNVFGGLVNKPKRLPSGGTVTHLGLGQFLDEVTRVVKPNGTVVIAEYYKHNGGLWLTAKNYSDLLVRTASYAGNQLPDFFKAYGIKEHVHIDYDPLDLPFAVSLKRAC